MFYRISIMGMLLFNISYAKKSSSLLKIDHLLSKNILLSHQQRNNIQQTIKKANKKTKEKIVTMLKGHQQQGLTQAGTGLACGLIGAGYCAYGVYNLSTNGFDVLNPSFFALWSLFTCAAFSVMVKGTTIHHHCNLVVDEMKK